MPPKVQIFLSDQAKKNAGGVALKTKKLAQGAGRPTNKPKSPAKKVQPGPIKKQKGKVVKSASRPVQKITNVKIVQPVKGAMQPGSSERKTKVIAQ